jgi:hypothetical protein
MFLWLVRVSFLWLLIFISRTYYLREHFDFVSEG